jgi:hypothetical protein
VQQGNPNFRDYIVAAQAPVLWLDPDNPTQTALFTEVLKGVQPDTPYLGWFPQGNEMPGVTLCGQYASPVIAADFYINGSVFAGGAPAAISSRITHPPVPKVQKKIYLTLTMVEGDNAQYNQHRMRDIWNDAGRGAVPLNWSISAFLYDLGPAIFSYYQRTATANDLLMAGPSGAGYTYPAVWPAAALEGYTQNAAERTCRPPEWIRFSPTTGTARPIYRSQHRSSIATSAMFQGCWASSTTMRRRAR